MLSPENDYYTSLHQTRGWLLAASMAVRKCLQIYTNRVLWIDCHAIRGGTYHKRQRECVGAACMCCLPVCVTLPRPFAVGWTHGCCMVPPTSHVCMREQLANASPAIDGKAASALLKIFLEASQAAKAAGGASEHHQVGKSSIELCFIASNLYKLPSLAPYCADKRWVGTQDTRHDMAGLAAVSRGAERLAGDDG